MSSRAPSSDQYKREYDLTLNITIISSDDCCPKSSSTLYMTIAEKGNIEGQRNEDEGIDIRQHHRLVCYYITEGYDERAIIRRGISKWITPRIHTSVTMAATNLSMLHHQRRASSNRSLLFHHQHRTRRKIPQ